MLRHPFEVENNWIRYFLTFPHLLRALIGARGPVDDRRRALSIKYPHTSHGSLRGLVASPQLARGFSLVPVALSALSLSATCSKKHVRHWPWNKDIQAPHRRLWMRNAELRKGLSRPTRTRSVPLICELASIVLSRDQLTDIRTPQHQAFSSRS